MGVWSALKALRRRSATVEAPEDAPGATISEAPLPDDVHAALRKLQGEMADMQLHWAEVLDKLTAWANRQSARDRQHARRALDQLATDQAPEQPPAHQDIPQQHTLAETKADLRRRAAALARGIA